MKKRAKRIKNAFLFTRVLNWVYTIMTLMFIFLSWSSYELNIQFIRYILYVGVIIFTPLVFIWDIYFYKVRLKKRYKLIFPLIGFIYILYLNPLELFNSAHKWNRIEILYENKANPKIKIEKQERKLLTSNRIETRTVVVNNFNDYFKKIKVFHRDHLRIKDWNKIE